MKQTVIALQVIALLLLAGSLMAQTPMAASFADLHGRIVPGMNVTATDSSGKRIHGQVAQMTEAALIINDHGDSFTFSANTLAEVRYRTQDSLLNGALIGAAAGAVPILVGLAGCEDCAGSDVLVLGAISCGAGAGIGVLIDSLFKKEVVIYRQVQMSWSVDPASRKHSPGLAFSLRW